MLIWTAVACRTSEPEPVRPEPARNAADAAAQLFRGARQGWPVEDFAILVEGELAGKRRVALAALLKEISGTTSAQIVGEGPAGDKTAVDLEATLRGGGKAGYHVQAREASGAWRIVSVVGPDTTWPPTPLPGGDGLTTSAPPG